MNGVDDLWQFIEIDCWYFDAQTTQCEVL